MKLKKEYAVLAVAIIVLGLYLFFRDTDRTTYTLPELPAVNAQDVTKVEIATQEGTITLARSDDGWRVSPGDYPADPDLVNRMLEILADLEVTVLVSETRNYGHYELDETHQIRVTAYRNGDALRALRIGKAADTMRHTHVRLSEDPNVYHARGNFRSDFDQTVARLRDKIVMAFKVEAVTALAIETADASIRVSKTEAPAASQSSAPASPEDDPGETAAQWQTGDGQGVASEAVAQLLASLSGLKCRAYLTGQSRDDLAEPTHRIRIEGEKAALLEIFPPADETATEVPASSSLREDLFTLADFDIDPIKDFLAILEDREDTTSP